MAQTKTAKQREQREAEIRAEMAEYLSHVHVPPAEVWSTGAEPATPRQIGYIKTEAAQSEDFETWEQCEHWTKAQASEHIRKIRDQRGTA